MMAPDEEPDDMVVAAIVHERDQFQAALAAAEEKVAALEQRKHDADVVIRAYGERLAAAVAALERIEEGKLLPGKARVVAREAIERINSQ